MPGPPERMSPGQCAEAGQRRAPRQVNDSANDGTGSPYSPGQQCADTETTRPRNEHATTAGVPRPTRTLNPPSSPSPTPFTALSLLHRGTPPQCPPSRNTVVSCRTERVSCVARTACRSARTRAAANRCEQACPTQQPKACQKQPRAGNQMLTNSMRRLTYVCAAHSEKFERGCGATVQVAVWC